MTASDMDEILIGSQNCSQLSGLLKLQVSRLRGELVLHAQTHLNYYAWPSDDKSEPQECN